jgi:uncharacterized protein (DUF1330 family)
MHKSWRPIRKMSQQPSRGTRLNSSFYEDLEGAATEGTVILEFPSMDAAKAWYDGPAYRKVREHRFKGATYHVILVKGV